MSLRGERKENCRREGRNLDKKNKKRNEVGASLGKGKKSTWVGGGDVGKGHVATEGSGSGHIGGKKLVRNGSPPPLVKKGKNSIHVRGKGTSSNEIRKKRRKDKAGEGSFSLPQKGLDGASGMKMGYLPN